VVENMQRRQNVKARVLDELGPKGRRIGRACEHTAQWVLFWEWQGKGREAIDRDSQSLGIWEYQTPIPSQYPVKYKVRSHRDFC